MRSNDPSYYLLQSTKPRVILNITRRLLLHVMPTIFALSLWIYFILDVSQKASTTFRSSSSNSNTNNNATIDSETEIISFDPDLPVFQFPKGMDEPLFLSQVDPSILIPVVVKPSKNNQSSTLIHEKKDERTNNVKHTVSYISTAHNQGLIHIGSLLYIIDSDNKILFLKRSNELVLCPNTWGLTGEHQTIHDLKEDGFINQKYMKNIIKRAVKEELGLDPSMHVKNIISLTNYPVYFRREYGPNVGNKIDKQLTYLVYVRLNDSHENIKFVFDNEVDDVRWIDIGKSREFLDSNDVCHGFMHAMLEIGIGSILRNSTLNL